VSKESKIKKKQKNSNKQAENKTPVQRRPLTSIEKAAIVRDSLARRPVVVFRYRNGKWNLKLIITMAILFVALIVSIYFLSRY
jgi:hypothetical protein